jgi:peptidyl-prolyl cis-trans isomerase SurA
LEFRTAGPKTFDEAKAEAITQFQDYLEKTWLQELERAYTFRLNEKVFKKLFRTAR